MLPSNARRRVFDAPVCIHRQCSRTLFQLASRRPISQRTAPIIRRQRGHLQSRPYSRQASPPSSRTPPSQPTQPTSKQPTGRVLEKPTRFNPPSHGSRRPRPAHNYPGPRLSAAEEAARSTKRYPNMMPPPGTFMHWFLTARSLHVWISLSTLTCLAGYTMLHQFVTTTELRDELPATGDLLSHPLQAVGQFVGVYKRHVQMESAQVRAKRQEKAEDAKKRHEFLRAHGVEPGFLTGSWAGKKFGTVEAHQFREEMEAKRAAEEEEEELRRRQLEEEQEVAEEQPRQKRRVKRWFGIWE